MGTCNVHGPEPRRTARVEALQRSVEVAISAGMGPVVVSRLIRLLSEAPVDAFQASPNWRPSDDEPLRSKLKPEVPMEAVKSRLGHVAPEKTEWFEPDAAIAGRQYGSL